MATLSQLVDAIAAAEGLEPATVTLMARHIREAGFVSTSGRGPSAAKMTVSDAANLLIGVNATRQASDAANVVRTYRALRAYEFRSLHDPRPESDWGSLALAVEQLIESCRTGRLPDPFFGDGISLDLEEAFTSGDVYIELKFRTSSPSASLRIWSLPGSDVIDPTAPDQWVQRQRPDIQVLFSPADRPRSRRSTQEQNGDRIEETTIGYPTLRAVGKLLAAD